MRKSDNGIVLERRTLNGVLIKQSSKGDLLKRIKQLDIERRPSEYEPHQKQSKANILKRANKKYSVANAVAVIGVTKALLIGINFTFIIHSLYNYV